MVTDEREASFSPPLYFPCELELFTRDLNTATVVYLSRENWHLWCDESRHYVNDRGHLARARQVRVCVRVPDEPICFERCAVL